MPLAPPHREAMAERQSGGRTAPPPFIRQGTPMGHFQHIWDSGINPRDVFPTHLGTRSGTWFAPFPNKPFLSQTHPKEELMPRIDGTTDAQSFFLRAFLKDPLGPEAKDWPAPAILDKWLTRPKFLRGLARVIHGHHFRSDLHLAAAADSAAQSLELLTANNATATLDDPNP